MPLTGRRVAIIAASLIVAALVGLGAAGWYYSNVMRDGAFSVQHSADAFDMTVAEVGEGTVTLRVTDDTDLTYGHWRQEGTWGLAWDGGHGEVGSIVELTDDQVVRSFTPIVGLPAVGSAVRFDDSPFDGDPLSGLGVPFEEVTVSSEAGEFPAWFVEGTRNTWAVFTHGKGATRKEALRALDTFAAQDVPSLVITYRNDAGLPASASGFYDYGKSEWEDLEAAVRYALDNGAEDVVLIGFSMGGAITASFLLNSDLADRVAGVVLDAPMVDFGNVIDYGAERRNLPGILTWAGKTVATMRFGVDWGGLDYLSLAEEIDAPVLLFHGDADRTVHVRTSDRLAEERPDIVTYVRVPGARHVGSWNVDPAAYDAALTAFIGEVIE